jgi:hypothetical protein
MEQIREKRFEVFVRAEEEEGGRDWRLVSAHTHSII